jgi:hypothetical protein
MKFVPLDQLGQWLTPNLEPAIDEPAQPKGRRGGRRIDTPWPLDRKRRLHATAELVRRWEKKMDYAETWKPWDEEVTWVRVTEAGLRTLGLDWHEISFPDDRKRLSIGGHTYQVNRRRIALARGSYQAPAHTWKCERAIYIEQYLQDAERVDRAHRPDGVLHLEADGSFPGPRRRDGTLEEIPLQREQTIAIEAELTQKNLERLGEGILPSLLRSYDFAWYFCESQSVYNAVVAARRDHLSSNEERKRIRILLLE